MDDFITERGTTVKVYAHRETGETVMQLRKQMPTDGWTIVEFRLTASEREQLASLLRDEGSN